MSTAPKRSKRNCATEASDSFVMLHPRTGKPVKMPGKSGPGAFYESSRSLVEANAKTTANDPDAMTVIQKLLEPVAAEPIMDFPLTDYYKLADFRDAKEHPSGKGIQHFVTPEGDELPFSQLAVGPAGPILSRMEASVNASHAVLTAPDFVPLDHPSENKSDAYHAAMADCQETIATVLATGLVELVADDVYDDEDLYDLNSHLCTLYSLFVNATCEWPDNLGTDLPVTDCANTAFHDDLAKMLGEYDMPLEALSVDDVDATFKDIETETAKRTAASRDMIGDGWLVPPTQALPVSDTTVVSSEMSVNPFPVFVPEDADFV